MATFKKAYWPHPEGPLDDKSELANVITPASWACLQTLLDGTKGTIVTGGKTKGKRISPEIIQGIQTDNILMEK